VPRRTALPLALLTALPVLAAVPGAHAAAPAYTVKALKITTTVASESALGTPATCVVDADLYTPTGVDKAHPAPAILTTNGFGGSKHDQAGLGAAYATKGYVVLSYSGLGFGSDATVPGSGSGCKITLDDREHDGAAGSQLIDFLGGLKAADDGTKVDYVTRDAVAHDGKAHSGDVRVGMVGGSYGGQIQFAVAGVDPRLDTVVPLITWNDLAYSLAPNNTSLPGSTSVTYATPGTEKLDWTTLFFGLGFADGIQATVATTDPTRLAPCTNFADEACVAKAQMDALGYPDATTTAFARNASVATYVDRVKIPTLLGQGQADTLFNLHEAVATYTSLRARKVPVKMIWQQWGHSHGPVPGEFDLAHPDANYEGRVITAWFDHYLKGAAPAPALDFSYYQDWLDKGDASKAFRSVPSYPVPGTTTLYASGTALTPSSRGLTPGSATIAVPPGGVPLSYTETSALDQSQPVRDLPGATTALSTGPLPADVDVVGIPTATLQLSSPTSVAADPATEVVAFVKLYDVAPDGTVTLAHRVISPIRVADLGQPVTVSLPGTVHRFPKGHALQLVVSLSDAAYKGNTVAQALTLSTSTSHPTTLTLPGRLRLTAAPATGTAPRSAGAPTAPAAATRTLPSTGGSTTAPLAGLAALLVAAAVARRRRTA
jgi:LPXTG-motif cell wall-anchored protein